jgi:cytochrome c
MTTAHVVLVAATAALFVAGIAHADEKGEELIKKNGCTACHSDHKKIVGPAYDDVAAKYKGDSSAVPKLMEKVKKGGSGVWGPIPMPPHPNISDADLKTMVTYILSLKKQ